MEDKINAMGLKQWDYAIPVGVAKALCDASNKVFMEPLKSVSGHFVWCYDSVDGTLELEGYPVAISPIGRKLIAKLAESSSL